MRARRLSQHVTLCQQGDAAAQRDLVLETKYLVYRTVFRIVGRIDADPVAQQVYLQALRHAHTPQIIAVCAGKSCCLVEPGKEPVCDLAGRAQQGVDELASLIAERVPCRDQSSSGALQASIKPSA